MKVKLLTDEFLPSWQKGIEVELEGEKLKVLLEKGSVLSLEETPQKAPEGAVAEEPKKVKSKKVLK